MQIKQWPEDETKQWKYKVFFSGIKLAEKKQTSQIQFGCMPDWSIRAICFGKIEYNNRWLFLRHLINLFFDSCNFTNQSCC
jgi:hypothetical protein